MPASTTICPAFFPCAAASIYRRLEDMRDAKTGKFTESGNPKGIFKKAWRGKKACHEEDWLRYRHRELGQSLAEMAADPKCRCTVANIRFWMKKLGVPIRPKGEQS